MPVVNVPSISQCLALIDRYAMLDNIREHSHLVARVAEAIVAGLEQCERISGQAADRALVMAGALLHDIAKTICLDGSCRHDEEGMKICCRHGYPEVGRIVREHVLLSSFTPENYRDGRFPAREIVYYADKRVRHNEIVSLEQRYEYIIDIYSRENDEIRERIRHNFNRCAELEGYLFEFLAFSPDELPAQVNHAPFQKSL